MQELDDIALLQEYVKHDSEKAFAALVTRHINKVYSVALRHTRNPHQAEEITQAVFVILAKKARQLSKQVILSGWLYETSRLTALTLIRSEIRRARREETAHMQTLLNKDDSDLWPQITPLLDTAMAALGETDRHAIVLRFFDGKTMKEVAAALGGSEDAAKMRVSRAVEKLRSFFAKRGIIVPAAVLATAISANAVQVAPPLLTQSAITMGLAHGVKASGSALTLIKGASKVMAWTKAKTAIVGVIIIGGMVTPFVIQQRTQNKLRDELGRQAQQIVELKAENARLLHPNKGDRIAPRLPAPKIRTLAPASQPIAESTNLISRKFQSEKSHSLTPEQIASYLNGTQRSAASLITAFRATGDQNLLREAMEKFPNDPLVNFAAILAPGLSPEEHRQELDAMKHSAPENALGYYLSALDYFKNGQTDQAVQELSNAYSKIQFQDFTKDLTQNAEEAYLAAGYSVAEAKTFAGSQLLLPHLAQLKQLGGHIIELADSYQQLGDSTSAEAALRIAVNLGQRYNGAPAEPLISQMVGLAIERNALNAMNPGAPWGNQGQTVNDRLHQIIDLISQFKSLNLQFESVQHQVTEQDWISYIDRWRAFGERPAAQWLVDKYRK